MNFLAVYFVCHALVGDLQGRLGLLCILLFLHLNLESVLLKLPEIFKKKKLKLLLGGMESMRRMINVPLNKQRSLEAHSHNQAQALFSL